MYKLESTNKKVKKLSNGQYILNKLKEFPKFTKLKIDNLPEDYQVMTLGRKAAYMTIKTYMPIPRILDTLSIIEYHDKEYGTDSVVIDWVTKDEKYGHKKYGSISLELAFYDKDFNTIPMYDTIYFTIPAYPSICNFLRKMWKLDLSVINKDNWIEIDNDNLTKNHFATNHSFISSFFGYDAFVYANKEEVENICNRLFNNHRTIFTDLTYIVDLS